MIDDPRQRPVGVSAPALETVEFIPDWRVASERMQWEYRLEMCRGANARFELRHGMSFDEFQARLEAQPESTDQEEYLEWCRVIEEWRDAEAALDRLERHRLRPAPAGSDRAEGKGSDYA